MDMGIWFLIGAALVFFMQCGFAMVETGFTRAKNAGNIIMKNTMDFCIGTVVFMLLGFGIMMGEHTFFGLIGSPDWTLFVDFKNFDWSSFVFQLVFCATAATIVSGSMAERTKFSSYCIYSAVISLIVYPIEAGWVWGNGGWLANLSYIDFAGSSVIHMVGGVTALIGAMFLGPRIGKYTRDKSGKVTKVNAIPGHSITLAALGVFILWFGWYGFNGAAAGDVTEMAQIFATTTVAPAVATVVCMIFTWVKDGKPDVGMCMNAALAGLVGITAGCASVDIIGAAIIGAVDGIIVDLAVEIVDKKFYIDDPVGAFAVHGVNGCWGTIAVGLFAENEKYGSLGLFYGGGFHQLGIQLLGVVCILAYTIVVMTVVFKIIAATNGLRVSEAEEIEGLDVTEHGLTSAYADFMPAAPAIGMESTGAVDLAGVAPTALTLGTALAEKSHKYTKVSIICNEDHFGELRDTLATIGVTGMTVSQVMGCGTQKGKIGRYRGVSVSMNLLPKVQVDIVVSKVDPQLVVAAAQKVLKTGKYGDGKIFVCDVEDIVKVRTGETGFAALQDESDK
ncbi:MAG: ammonium transporter [Oscillibacter sp.]|jgi:Amt family ammonium transporter|nr:ammonium transporter [Oscillibacter sp.]